MHGWRRVAASIALLIAGFGLSCEGFFVDPILTGIAVGPSATIQTGKTMQMSAVGTYDDGRQKSLSSGVFWSSGNASVATVSTTGLVTGVGSGQSVITGASGTVSASATVTVTLGGLTSIQVTTEDGLTSIVWGSSEQFVATGTANGQQINITDSVNWTTDSHSPSVSIDSKTGLLTTTSGPTDTVQFNVIATDLPTGISNHMKFTVHP